MLYPPDVFSTPCSRRSSAVFLLLILTCVLVSPVAADPSEQAIAQAIHNAIHVSRDAGAPTDADIRKWKRFGTTSHGVGYLVPDATFGEYPNKIGMNLSVHFIHNREQVQRELDQFAPDYIRDDAHSGAKIYAGRRDQYSAPNVIYYYKDDTTYQGREVYILVRLIAALPTRMRDMSEEEAVAATIGRWRYFYDEAVRLGVLEGGDDYWVDFEWDPHNPMLVRVLAKQKIDGTWKTPDPPVHIALHMTRRPALADREAHLVNAYRARTALSHRDRPDKMVFMSPTHEDDAPFYSTATERQSTIDLRQGLQFHLVRAGSGASRWEFNHEYWIRPPALGDTWAPLLETMSEPDDYGKLVADVQVFLYRLDDDHNIITLAASPKQQIHIDHIAEVRQFNCWDTSTLRAEVFRPRFGTIEKPTPEQIGQDFGEEKRWWLLPNDKITLGPQDGVKIFFLLNQEEWVIRSNPAGFGGVFVGRDQDRAEVYIYPVGGPGIEGRIKWGLSGIAGIGISAGVTTFMPMLGPWTSASVAAFSTGIAQWTLDGWLWPEDLSWTPIRAGGTRYGLEMASDSLEVYLFEGVIRASTVAGNEQTLAEGQMVRVTRDGIAPPRAFSDDRLSVSMASVIEAGAARQPRGTHTADMPTSRDLSSTSANDAGKSSPTQHDIPALNADVRQVRFFEMGTDYPPAKDRLFDSEFYATKTRRIGWHINLDYPSLAARHDFVIHALWTSPDGVTFARQNLTYHIDPGWTTSYHAGNWGWNQPGNWAPGQYTVAFHVDGRQFARGTFTIVSKMSLDEQYDLPSLRANVRDVRFYEVRNGFPPISERTFATRFSRAVTRRINWQINLDFMPPGARKDFKIDAEWRRPDGSLLAKQTVDTHIDATWSSSNHSQGWGWEDPGNWPPGRYRLKFYVNGNQFADGSFEVYDEGRAGK